MANFSERLKELRIEKRLTQEQLADKFYLNKSSISRYERGQQVPELELLQQIADFFSVSTDYLLGNSDIRNPYNNDKNLDIVDEFLIELKEEMEKEGLEFDETSPQELIETYKLLLEFKKKIRKE